MFEVMPEDQAGQGLLAATLRLVDRSGVTPRHDRPAKIPVKSLR
jgi:hypothetical protein